MLNTGPKSSCNGLPRRTEGATASPSGLRSPSGWMWRSWRRRAPEALSRSSARCGRPSAHVPNEIKAYAVSTRHSPVPFPYRRNQPAASTGVHSYPFGAISLADGRPTRPTAVTEPSPPRHHAALADDLAIRTFSLKIAGHRAAPHSAAPPTHRNPRNEYPVRLLLRRRQGGRPRRHAQPPRRQGRQPPRDDQHRPARPGRLHPQHRHLHLFLSAQA